MTARDVIAESTAKLVRATKDPAMWSLMDDGELEMMHAALAKSTATRLSRQSAAQATPGQHLPRTARQAEPARQ